MNEIYSQMQWLPRVPPEFSTRLKALGDLRGPLGPELQGLAMCALDLNQLTKLAKAKIDDFFGHIR